MTAFFEKSWGAFVAAFIGSLMALVMIPLLFILWQQIYEIYDDHNPPVVINLAAHEMASADNRHMRFQVTRHDDCDFLKMQGYSGKSPLQMQPSAVRRADGEPPIDYPLGITVLSSTWALYPVHGPEIRLQGYYACGSRIVRPVLLETRLNLNGQSD
ncbi:MAG: hypothetical protein IPH85_13675 [Ignavibacteria bacterium]|nr:hypothetical protein [Ignavibacteria bacterium]